MSVVENNGGAIAGATAGRQFLRRAAASCYCHSPLPAVTRRLRERYRFTRAGGRFGLRKREGATARILLYHRVNDDGDPFFPAISTALFEAEMRVLRRWHRVVSLSELMTRLEEGPAEPVVALTFDDGYRDNYLNAFPILQGLGLPATIFLTTGSMDSGEPLWFERLALAFKKTSRSSIEADGIAQPISLRTTSERLAANGAVFSRLQRLADAERRRRLAEILTQLGVDDDGERRWQMLKWDEARLMSKAGVSFGGHTVDHPFVSRLAPEQLCWQVSECKRRVEEEMQRPADFFAYPNGREDDFGASNKPLIRQAGYRAAVTTIWGVNDSSTDPFELRRGGPWETTGALFASKLDWYELTQE